jgi:ATP phosphoribosyltransferase
MNNTYLKLAVQKKGRLAEETLAFLRKSGLEFDSYTTKLFSTCRNFPMEILFLRDDDIARYVAAGTVDIGIVGQNILYEERPQVKKLLNLRYGFCSLVVAVPKESTIKKLSDLAGKTIATTYPASTRNFFAKNTIAIKTVSIRGSVEIAPTLGVADAIADLSSSGSTLTLNDLQFLANIYDSEAVLIASNTTKKQLPLSQLLTRFKSVLSAKNYKYIILNAPEKALLRIRKIIPSVGTPTILPLPKEGWLCIQTVIKEDAFWQVSNRLQNLGVTNIVVQPIEKII